MDFDEDVNHDLETIEEGALETEQQKTDDEDEDDQPKKEVKSKRVVRDQPKLNLDSLRGPKGIPELLNLFKDVNFKGQSHEKENLNKMMKVYEYWCHRMFPKFTFDDCLAKIEKLGKQKLVQTYIHRIRLDLVDELPILAPEDVVQGSN